MRKSLLFKNPFASLNLLMLCAFLLSGCGSAASQGIHLADGSPAFHITCSGAFSGINSCFEKAAYLCGNNGYTVIRQNDSSFYATWNPYYNSNPQPATNDREIIAKCGHDLPPLHP